MATYTIGNTGVAAHVTAVRILPIHSLTIIYPADTVTFHLPEADSSYGFSEVVEQGRGPQPKVCGYRLGVKVFITPNNYREMMPALNVLGTKTPFKVRLWLQAQAGQSGGGGMYIGGGTIGGPGGTGFDSPDPDPSDDYIIQCGVTFGIDSTTDRPRLWVEANQIYSKGALATLWDATNPTGFVFHQLNGWGD